MLCGKNVLLFSVVILGLWSDCFAGGGHDFPYSKKRKRVAVVARLIARHRAPQPVVVPAAVVPVVVPVVPPVAPVIHADGVESFFQRERPLSIEDVRSLRELRLPADNVIAAAVLNYCLTGVLQVVDRGLRQLQPLDGVVHELDADLRSRVEALRHLQPTELDISASAIANNRYLWLVWRELLSAYTQSHSLDELVPALVEKMKSLENFNEMKDALLVAVMSQAGARGGAAAGVMALVSLKINAYLDHPEQIVRDVVAQQGQEFVDHIWATVQLVFNRLQAAMQHFNRVTLSFPPCEDAVAVLGHYGLQDAEHNAIFVRGIPVALSARVSEHSSTNSSSGSSAGSLSDLLGGMAFGDLTFAFGR